ncbi:MAG: hypothetical protein C0483_25850 [Pirellula sp.]|nr:hypothetical protein [Pirellula sp.]
MIGVSKSGDIRVVMPRRPIYTRSRPDRPPPAARLHPPTSRRCRMPLPLRVCALTVAFGLLTSAGIVMRAQAVETKEAGNSGAAKGHDFFEARIRPVLVEHCYKCHSSAAGKTEGGLALDTRGAMRAGGSSGPAVVPSDEERSLILAAIRHDGLEMPPERKLPPEVIADFEKWIALGAPDPREGLPPATKPTVDYAAARKHWAFQPVRPVAPPPSVTGRKNVDPVDRFIQAKLAETGFTPAPAAERRALLRRTTFLLTGLPPTPHEVTEFVNDASPQAFERVVDRLLASSTFGERWGRHWLDTARYAESNGKSMNLVWPHAWRYRDYVVDAMNRDLPYDEFLRQQIAGDLLPAASDEARAAQTIATGLLALGAKSYEEAGAREKYLLELADDQIDVVARGMLGLTVACARCHDHKFDPVPQADYYAMAGVFLSSETLAGPGPKHSGYKGYDAPYQPVGAEAERLHGPYEAHDTKLRAKNTELGGARSSRYRHVKNKTSLGIERKQAAASDKAKLAELDAQLKVEEAKIAEWDAKIAAMIAEIDTLTKSYPPSPDYAMAMREGKQPQDCALRYRGDWKRAGPPVPRGAPSLFASLKFGPSSKINAHESGRLQLAAWITDPQNPLTARVAVNRIWAHLFGRGIVTTLDNFGTLGAEPTHPELLDYLAGEFVRDGWSIKRMIRRLVLTETFQAGLAERSPLAAADPENKLFGRRTYERLEAEALRDAMLAVSGSLQSSRPIGSRILEAKVNSANAVETPPAQEIERPVRTLYLTTARSAVPEMLTLFDFPDPSLPASAREQRTLPTQALYLMNAPEVVTLARRLAERVLGEIASDDAARIDLLHELCLGRPATQAEQLRIAEFLKSQGGEKPAERIDAWSAVCQTLFAAAEFRFLP